MKNRNSEGAIDTIKKHIRAGPERIIGSLRLVENQILQYQEHPSFENTHLSFCTGLNRKPKSIRELGFVSDVKLVSQIHQRGLGNGRDY